MSERNLLIIGSGGHGRVVLDCALSLDIFSTIEFATNADQPAAIPGFRILDERAMTPESIASDYAAVVVAIGDNHARLEKVDQLEKAGVPLPVIVHPSAVVSRFAQIGNGSVVMAGAVVNASARIGKGCIVNTGAVVEHDCSVEDGAHLSPNSAIGGGALVGKRSWLCIGSSIADHVTLAGDSVLAGGSCLVTDALGSGLYAGVPALLKKRNCR